MAAYVVFIRETTADQTELEEYSDNVEATFKGHDFRLLADYGQIEILEGADVEGAVILEFPTMSEARGWYYSPEYQTVAQHRFRGARYRGFILAGS